MFRPFFRALSKIPDGKDYTNLYRGNSKASSLRRKNLELYLKLMDSYKPEVLLLGEAPGYKGARLTGLPFSCEDLVFGKIEHPVFGLEKGYERWAKAKLEKERSAHMVWNELGKYKELPLIWNIFPFHPHHEDKILSNRSPRISELRIGQPFVSRLLKLFPIQRIGAIGQKAYKGLSEMSLENYELRYIRHPSYGGKADFVKGLGEFLNPLAQAPPP
ncbi:MAG: uracil-DNA glycosylase [Bacteroidota bacterium]